MLLRRGRIQADIGPLCHKSASLTSNPHRLLSTRDNSRLCAGRQGVTGGIPSVYIPLEKQQQQQRRTSSDPTIELILRLQGSAENDWPTDHQSVRLRLTCAAAEGEAQSALGAVEHHVEALHDGGADHQTVDRRRHAEAEAVQRSVHTGDLLDVELGERGGRMRG